MNGRLAKRLRRQVWGRGYTGKLERQNRGYKFVGLGKYWRQAVADPLRGQYQGLKRFLVRGS